MIRPLTTRSVAKPWGRDVLPAPFVGADDQRIGEIWFEPPAELASLLVKYIFTSDKLSVQVHPSDTQTLAAGLGQQGKEECWLVIDAEPGATLGIGFDAPMAPAALRAAALDGSVERLLTWHQVQAGDFFYIPANTVHAIGGGIALIEVQQNSDITYRLYDYGRPRELHLDEAVAVARSEPYTDPRRRTVLDSGEQWLVDGPLFRLLRYDGPLSREAAARLDHDPCLVIPMLGDVGPVAAGACGIADGVNDFAIATGACGLIAQTLVRG